MNSNFRLATATDSPKIWEILQQAIARRKADGSNQWQNGYPNPETIQQDINRGVGFVLTHNNEVIAYSAVLINDEPAYDAIEGNWLSTGDFLVIHRVAIDEAFLGQGKVQELFGLFEVYALSKNIHSIKVDTNFDNGPMLRILEKLGYTYCGQVYFNGSARRAFEKVF